MLALLVADAVVACAAMGPCNITMAAKVINGISCVGSFYPPVAGGCTGGRLTVVQQGACQNMNCDTCPDGPINRWIMRVGVLVSPGNQSCSGWGTTTWGIPYHYDFQCVPGPPFVALGGNECG